MPDNRVSHEIEAAASYLQGDVPDPLWALVWWMDWTAEAWLRGDIALGEHHENGNDERRDRAAAE